MEEQRRFNLLLAVTVGLISALAVLLMSEGHISFLVCAFIAVGGASLIGLLRPPPILRHTTIAALGIPVLTILRIIYDLAAGVSDHNLFPIEVFLALGLGAVFAFSGMAVGTGLRFLFKKAQPTETERTPSKFARGTLISVSVVMFGILLFKIISIKPAPPLEVGVHVGGDILSKTIIVSQPEIGNVTSIKVLSQLSDTDAILLVVGDRGAIMLARQGSLKSLVKFEERVGKVEPVGVGRNGEFEYVNKGGGWQPVSLISSTGKTLWKSPPKEAPDDMTAIDLDDNGVTELVVGMNAKGGLRAFDRNGNELWMQPATNVFSVAAVNVDGSTEIVHTDGNEIVIRSVKGDKLRTMKLPFFSFAIGRWPKAGYDPVIIGMHESSIKAFDFKGEAVGRLPIQTIGRDVAATPVTFSGQEDTSYAVVVSLLASSHLSELYLFDGRDTLVYHEVFKGMYPSVAAIPTQNGVGEFLLVGGADGTITEYRMKRKGSL